MATQRGKHDHAGHRAYRRATFAINVLAPLAAVALAANGMWPLGVVAIAVGHAMWMVPTLWPECGWAGRVVTGIEALDPSATDAVWVTIDDGPHPEDTPALLDILDRHDATATFFFIGERAAAHPELVAEVRRRGHTIGNHTLSHPHLWFWAYGPSGVRREIEGAQQALADAGAEPPTLFRAPVGFKSPLVSAAVDRLGLNLICWSVRGYDGVSADRDAVIERLTHALAPGDIVLMHEARPASDGDRLAPGVLDALLSDIERRGLRTWRPPARA